MKCKEMLVCFLPESLKLSPLVINEQTQEIVHAHKVLGLIIQTDLYDHYKLGTNPAFMA